MKKFLILDGNTPNENKIKNENKIPTYGDIFCNLVLSSFKNENVICDVFEVANETKKNFNIAKIQEYSGVLWTGSSLSISEKITPEIEKQLDFCHNVFNSGIAMYGSCYGLQIATQAAGGKVVKSKKGLEIGVAKNITLSHDALSCPYFKNRKPQFEAYCVHTDEVETLPYGAKLLASNKHSKVQAAQFVVGDCQFFGVQYHPEFTYTLMLEIYQKRLDNLIKQGLFKQGDTAKSILQEIIKQYDINKQLSHEFYHSQEISAWLKEI